MNIHSIIILSACLSVIALPLWTFVLILHIDNWIDWNFSLNSTQSFSFSFFIIGKNIIKIINYMMFFIPFFLNFCWYTYVVHIWLMYILLIWHKMKTCNIHKNHCSAIKNQKKSYQSFKRLEYAKTNTHPTAL